VTLPTTFTGGQAETEITKGTSRRADEVRCVTAPRKMLKIYTIYYYVHFPASRMSMSEDQYTAVWSRSVKSYTGPRPTHVSTWNSVSLRPVYSDTTQLDVELSWVIRRSVYSDATQLNSGLKDRRRNSAQLNSTELNSTSYWVELRRYKRAFSRPRVLW